MTSAADAIIPLYRRHADVWITRRANAPVPPVWIDRFAAMLPAAARVLDIGCGSGAPIARHLLERGFAVTGVDTSPELLAHARATLPAGTWHAGDMRTLDLGIGFHGVLAWNSAFHLTPSDQRSLFAIYRRHCLPDGVLMFTSGVSEGTAMGTFEGEPLYHGSLDHDEFRTLLRTSGFALIDQITQDPACGDQTIWLAKLRR